MIFSWKPQIVHVSCIKVITIFYFINRKQEVYPNRYLSVLFCLCVTLSQLLMYSFLWLIHADCLPIKKKKKRKEKKFACGVVSVHLI